ncbi:MAG: aldehyde dehydrogenase family protein, partial [Woeseia sp.]|nr:aldehyde dehydrogenase family protein [Woeseia sp.]
VPMPTSSPLTCQHEQEQQHRDLQPATSSSTTTNAHATHFKRHSESGCVMVNLPTAGTDYHVPFGGRKSSSYGPREMGRYAQEFYTIVKTAYQSA